MPKPNYDLTKAAQLSAIQTNLSAADWYHSTVPRAKMKALMARSDQPALWDSFVLFGSMALFGGIGIALWATWWAVPFWLAYGVLYGSAMDSRWHECGHSTAFKTRHYNTIVYHIASFCMIRNPTTWRWSHSRHHTDTIIVGRDPEIVAMRPPALIRIGASFFGIPDAWDGWGRMLLNASGKLGSDEALYVPKGEQHKVIRVARVWVAIYLAVLSAAVLSWSLIPLMLIGLPRLYGAWHHVMTGLLQHAGLAENVLDHRLNSRTVYMNPVSRFIYWNMNYHVEHHMFPMVPYFNLPRLHDLIKDDLPQASPSIPAAYAEVIPTLLRQLHNDAHFLKRELPASAQPYREDFHREALPQESFS